MRVYNITSEHQELEIDKSAFTLLDPRSYRLSLFQFFAAVRMNILNFCMKLGCHLTQNVTEPDFSKKIWFWGFWVKRTQIGLK